MRSGLGRLARRDVVLLAAPLAVLALVWGGVAAYRATVRPTPFPLASMQARATFAVTDAAHAQGLMDRAAGPGRMPTFVFRHRQHLVGQLRFRTVATPGDAGELVLFVIDNRLHKPVGHLAGVGPRGGGDVSTGWGGYRRLAADYPWLRSLADLRGPPTEAGDPTGLGLLVATGPGGYAPPGESLSFPPTARGPVTFTAVLDPDAPPLDRPERDLSFVLAYVRDDGSWAQRVPASVDGARRP